MYNRPRGICRGLFHTHRTAKFRFIGQFGKSDYDVVGAAISRPQFGTFPGRAVNNRPYSVVIGENRLPDKLEFAWRENL